jgi:hypothetical protein
MSMGFNNEHVKHPVTMVLASHINKANYKESPPCVKTLLSTVTIAAY